MDRRLRHLATATLAGFAVLLVAATCRAFGA